MIKVGFTSLLFFFRFDGGGVAIIFLVHRHKTLDFVYLSLFAEDGEQSIIPYPQSGRHVGWPPRPYHLAAH